MTAIRTSEDILAPLALFGVRPGLDTIRRLLAELGDPHRTLRSVVVAGTNGKGSTAALIASVTSSARYRTGLYTSPHLESVTERIRIDGEAIEEPELAQILERVVAAAEAIDAQATYFEVMTAAALIAFAEAKVHLAVLEVGLGGRLDAVNVVDPILSVVTQIDLDHREHLGDTLDAIAREKAGIFRPGVAAVSAAGSEEAVAALRAEAQRLGADWAESSETVSIEAIQRFDPGHAGRQRIWAHTGERADVLELGLAGRHQAQNLTLVVAAVDRLRDLGFDKIKNISLRRGVAECWWPGRLESVELPRGPRVLLDAAHNRGGAKVLAEFLNGVAAPRVLLFGVLADKEPEAMLAELAGCYEVLVLTQPPGDRGLGVDAVVERLPADPEAIDLDDAIIEADWRVALERGLAQALSPKVSRKSAKKGKSRFAKQEEVVGTLVIAGSLHLVGEMRAALTERFGVPEPATRPLRRP